MHDSPRLLLDEWDVFLQHCLPAHNLTIVNNLRKYSSQTVALTVDRCSQKVLRV